jgi:hypothetical protein
MYKPALLAIGVLALTVLGCSSGAPVRPQQASPRMSSAPAYTVEETKWLTYCVGLTDTAWSVANRKIACEKRARSCSPRKARIILHAERHAFRNCRAI